MTLLNSPPGGFPSPCIKRCQLDDTQTCTGCRRTIAEIIAWSKADEAEKFAIWQRLLALPMEIKSKDCQRCGATFTCGSGGRDGGCWCADLPKMLPLDPAQGDCLCPACLRAKLGIAAARA